MRYFQAYRFLFESPKWLTTLLAGSLCQLVPVVGPIVFQGYMFDVMEAKHRSWKREGYPDFDTNRLVPYLIRGLWPFLVQLIVSLPIAIFAGVFYVVILFSVITTADRQPEFPVALFLVYMLVLGVASFVVALVTIPMSLRAGLSQDFKSAFSLGFVRDFLRRVWLETILVQLFLFVTAPFVALAGLLLCCIGLYPATALIAFTQYHLFYQLYELYLERGGTPIPLKEPDQPSEAPEGPRVYPASEED